MIGCIFKRQLKSGISWGYSFFAGRDENGKRIQIYESGFQTKKEAADAQRKAIEQHRNGGKPTPEVILFKDFFERWIKEHASRRCMPKTLERYEQLGAYAVRKLGDMPLPSLSPMLIETMLHELEDRGGRIDNKHPDGRPLARKTVRNIAFTMHGCLETAVRWDLLRANPMDRVELPKPIKHRPQVPDHDRMRTLLDHAEGKRLYPLLVVAAATGCRRGELLALQWPDVDFDSGILSVSKSLEETKAGLRVKGTKSGESRRFALPAQAIVVLREHKAEQDREREMFGPDYASHNLVFCRPDGEYYRPDKVSVRVTELAREAGLPGVGLHSLRHAHASELLSKGAPIPTVAKRLGHANPNVTLSIYSHALEADELAAAKIWNDAMSDVIHTNRRPAAERARMLADVSAEPDQNRLNARKKTG